MGGLCTRMIVYVKIVFEHVLTFDLCLGIILCSYVAEKQSCIINDISSDILYLVSSQKFNAYEN